MASFPLRPHTRVLLFITISSALVAFVCLSAIRQHASAAPDQGVITPAGNTITVNSLSDVANGSDGLCTLREAIAAANNNAASGATAGECAAGSSSGSDTISFSVTGTISLTGVLPDITSDISINGPGSGLLTVRRNTGGDYRIFFTGSSNVNISGLTITNGKTLDGLPGANNGGSAPNGGGILQTGGSLSLTDVVITTNSTGMGGVANGGASAFGGSGGSGGGIFSSGVLTMTNCVISGNSTGSGGTGGEGGSGGFGGGLYFGLGTLTLTNVAVTGNHTGDGATGISSGLSGGESGYGGGIWIGLDSSNAQNPAVTMTKINISNNGTGNVVRSDAGRGGGLYIYKGTVTLSNSIVSNNVTGSGSGFLAAGGSGGGLSNFGTLTVMNSTISGNATGNGDTGGSGNDGGGISNGFILKLINSTISGNSTGVGSSSGGGLSAGGTVVISDCTIAGNVANNTLGNGISASNNISVRNSIVAGNGPGGNGPDLNGSFNNTTFNSLGHNLIGNGDGVNGFTNGNNGDQVGTGASPINPQLSPLANNGGATMTHALLSTSPALDAGDNCVTQAAHCGDANTPQLTTDQRGAGFNRLVDGPDADTTPTIDIGAYEQQAGVASLADTSTNEDTTVVVPFDVGDTSTVTSVTATSSNAAVG